jgi:hypothetical protein
MNSKSVLKRIMTLLSSDEVVKFTDAKDAKGNILQSPTFDLGEDVEVVSEDGTKSPAPDGEHEIELADSEGNKVVIRIETKDGKITSRENVEEASPADLEKVDEEVVDKKAAEEEQLADATTEIAKSLPNTTDEDIRNSLGEDPDETKDPIIRLGSRMDALEKMIAEMQTKMESAAPMEGAPLVSSLEPTTSGTTMSAVEPDEDEELPKLDGAPIDPLAIEANRNNFGKKSGNYQSSVLSKMYR